MTKSSFVTKLDLSLSDKLRNDLIDQGFELSKPDHTVFSAKKRGLSCTLYLSGKLLVQGKNKDDFIAFYLEPEILKNLSYTHPETLVDLTPRIGIDEAGKGDFFGPLCVAGVFAGEGQVEKLVQLNVQDSKRLNDENITAMASEIRTLFPHSIVRFYPKKYNELYDTFKNLNRLLAWGHAKAISELVQNTGCHHVIIDQFAAKHVVENALKQQKTQVDLTQRHYGEEDPVVAAASILARSAFVAGLEQLEKMIGHPLPKGANSGVVETAKAIVAKQGKESLKKIAKLHFKTTQQVINA